MKKQEKEFYLNKKSIGYFSAFAGVEVKEIEYSTDNYCICIVGAWCSKKTVHRLKINYSTKGDYIVINGNRLYFSDFIRI